LPECMAECDPYVLDCEPRVLELWLLVPKVDPDWLDDDDEPGVVEDDCCASRQLLVRESTPPQIRLVTLRLFIFTPLLFCSCCGFRTGQ